MAAENELRVDDGRILRDRVANRRKTAADSRRRGTGHLQQEAYAKRERNDELFIHAPTPLIVYIFEKSG
jgi:hypothetical protein